MLKTILVILPLISWSYVIHADTLIKIKVEDGNISEIMSNGKATRMSMAPEPGYVLISHSNNNMHIVIPEEKTILNMSPGKSQDKPEVEVEVEVEVDIKIKHIGNGPKIAGYSTKKYNLKADGQDCGIIYGSKKALKNPDIRNIYNAVNDMMVNQIQMMGGLPDTMDACERSEMNLSDQTKITGFPLKTIDQNGSLTSEVVSINTGAKFPAGTFILPSDYAMTTMAEMMRGAGQQMADEMQKSMKHMPDMEQMMNEMNKSGQLSPEVIEEMKKVQEMMKQFQQ